jgi:uncharacterized protein YndB with AHSA1/START domain
MNIQINLAPVQRSVRVAAQAERAFSVFTDGMTRWWNREHRLGKSPLKEVVLEPRVGGRWYEIGEDGSRCDWGCVLIWEPPNRIVLAWQINGDWNYDPDFVTELEVRFVPDGETTRVELEHRNIERFGDKAAETRAQLDSPQGWSGELVAFARVVEASA